ncbi:MAG: hypothetical protein M3M85_02690 [bacterium]|nr:hypothetical protein [bacterium]
MPINDPPDPLQRRSKIIENASKELPEEIHRDFNVAQLSEETKARIQSELQKFGNVETTETNDPKTREVKKLKNNPIKFFKRQLRDTIAVLQDYKKNKTPTENDLKTIARLENEEAPALERIIADLEKNIIKPEPKPEILSAAPEEVAPEPILSVDEVIPETTPEPTPEIVSAVSATKEKVQNVPPRPDKEAIYAEVLAFAQKHILSLEDFVAKRHKKMSRREKSSWAPAMQKEEYAQYRQNFFSTEMYAKQVYYTAYVNGYHDSKAYEAGEKFLPFEEWEAIHYPAVEDNSLPAETNPLEELEIDNKYQFKNEGEYRLAEFPGDSNGNTYVFESIWGSDDTLRRSPEALEKMLIKGEVLSQEKHEAREKGGAEPEITLVNPTFGAIEETITEKDLERITDKDAPNREELLEVMRSALKNLPESRRMLEQLLDDLSRYPQGLPMRESAELRKQIQDLLRDGDRSRRAGGIFIDEECLRTGNWVYDGDGLYKKRLAELPKEDGIYTIFNLSRDRVPKIRAELITKLFELLYHSGEDLSLNDKEIDDIKTSLGFDKKIKSLIELTRQKEFDADAIKEEADQYKNKLDAALSAAGEKKRVEKEFENRLAEINSSFFSLKKRLDYYHEYDRSRQELDKLKILLDQLSSDYGNISYLLPQINAIVERFADLEKNISALKTQQPEKPAEAEETEPLVVDVAADILETPATSSPDQELSPKTTAAIAKAMQVLENLEYPDLAKILIDRLKTDPLQYFENELLNSNNNLAVTEENQDIGWETEAAGYRREIADMEEVVEELRNKRGTSQAPAEATQKEEKRDVPPETATEKLDLSRLDQQTRREIDNELRVLNGLPDSAFKNERIHLLTTDPLEYFIGEGKGLATAQKGEKTPDMKKKQKRVRAIITKLEEISPLRQKEQEIPTATPEIEVNTPPISTAPETITKESFVFDERFGEALRVILETRQTSPSYLQRRLKLGYPRAAGLVEKMEELAIVGPSVGTSPREILWTDQVITNFIDTHEFVGSETPEVIVQDPETTAKEAVEETPLTPEAAREQLRRELDANKKIIQAAQEEYDEIEAKKDNRRLRLVEVDKSEEMPENTIQEIYAKLDEITKEEDIIAIKKRSIMAKADKIVFRKQKKQELEEHLGILSLLTGSKEREKSRLKQKLKRLEL